MSLVPLYRPAPSWRIAAPFLMAIATATTPGAAQDRIGSFNHFVAHASTIPKPEGQQVQLFVRERVDLDLAGSDTS
jgi:hypothetical protein